MLRVPFASIVVLTFAVFVAVGCSSNNREVPQQATGQLVAIRDQLTEGKASIQKVNDAASDLSERPRSDLNPQISRLSDELESLRGVAAKTRGEAQAADAEAKAYFSKWEAQIQTMSDDVAKSATRRQAEARASYAKLTEKVDEIKPLFRRYMDNLTEADNYLKTDSTAPGLEVVQPKLKDAIKIEPALERAIDGAIAEIDRIRAGK